MEDGCLSAEAPFFGYPDLGQQLASSPGLSNGRWSPPGGSNSASPAAGPSHPHHAFHSHHLLHNGAGTGGGGGGGGGVAPQVKIEPSSGAFTPGRAQTGTLFPHRHSSEESLSCSNMEETLSLGPHQPPERHPAMHGHMPYPLVGHSSGGGFGGEPLPPVHPTASPHRRVMENGFHTPLNGRGRPLAAPTLPSYHSPPLYSPRTQYAQPVPVTGSYAYAPPASRLSGQDPFGDMTRGKGWPAEALVAAPEGRLGWSGRAGAAAAAPSPPLLMGGGGGGGGGDSCGQDLDGDNAEDLDLLLRTAVESFENGLCGGGGGGGGGGSGRASAAPPEDGAGGVSAAARNGGGGGSGGSRQPATCPRPPHHVDHPHMLGPAAALGCAHYDRPSPFGHHTLGTPAPSDLNRQSQSAAGLLSPQLSLFRQHHHQPQQQQQLLLQQHMQQAQQHRVHQQAHQQQQQQQQGHQPGLYFGRVAQQYGHSSGPFALSVLPPHHHTSPTSELPLQMRHIVPMLGGGLDAVVTQRGQEPRYLVGSPGGGGGGDVEALRYRGCLVTATSPAGVGADIAPPAGGGGGGLARLARQTSAPALRHDHTPSVGSEGDGTDTSMPAVRSALTSSYSRGEPDGRDARHAPHPPAARRKGKGGRCPATDPRLDPAVDPKKARRILANRVSAARSKMKQKQLMEGLRTKHDQLKSHKESHELELSQLRAMCVALEAKNTLLQAKVEVLAVLPAASGTLTPATPPAQPPTPSNTADRPTQKQQGGGGSQYCGAGGTHNGANGGYGGHLGSGGGADSPSRSPFSMSVPPPSGRGPSASVAAGAADLHFPPAYRSMGDVRQPHTYLSGRGDGGAAAGALHLGGLHRAGARNGADGRGGPSHMFA